MYAIKMDGDKSLTITSRAEIYRGDKNCDMLAFYLPAAYDEVSIADCTVFMNYLLPSAEKPDETDLGIPARLYKGYLVYELAVDERLTRFSGDITVWLDFKDGLGVSYFQTGSALIPVLPALGSSDYITQDELDEVVQKVETLEKSKADSLTYDEDTGELQLTAGGSEIGDTVTLPYTSDGTFDFNIISGGGASASSKNIFSGGEAGQLD